MRKTGLFILVILTIALAACSAARSEESFAAPAMEEMESDFGGGYDEGVTFEQEAVALDKAANVADSTTGSSIQRMVVEDPLQKLDDIAAMADEMGGFVVDSNVWQYTLNNGAKVPHANITVRVPASRLDEALDLIKAGVGEILSENVSGQDVTSDYTDLESRLRNLEAAEVQLQAIMDEARETEDVLQVYNNLISVREQIEVIKGQMKYFEEAARLSRISVDITGDEEAQPLQIGGWQPAGVAKDAIETMVNTLQKLGDIAIWGVLCVLPIGIVVGIPLFFVVRYVRRLRKRQKAEKAALIEDAGMAAEASLEKE